MASELRWPEPLPRGESGFRFGKKSAAGAGSSKGVAARPLQGCGGLGTQGVIPKAETRSAASAADLPFVFKSLIHPSAYLLDSSLTLLS